MRESRLSSISYSSQKWNRLERWLAWNSHSDSKWLGFRMSFWIHRWRCPLHYSLLIASLMLSIWNWYPSHDLYRLRSTYIPQYGIVVCMCFFERTNKGLRWINKWRKKIDEIVTCHKSNEENWLNSIHLTHWPLIEST